MDVVCFEDMLAPDAVVALDKAKDRQRIYVVALGQAVGLDQSLSGVDVSPGGLLGDETGEQ